MKSQTEQRVEIKFNSEKSFNYKSRLLSRGFIKTNDDRHIHSVYYDTLKLKFFKNHIDGDNNRHKYRLRTYGELKSKGVNFNLEIKKKHSLYGSKIRYDNFWFLKNDNKLPIINSEFDGNIEPKLLVSYIREYYYKPNFDIRATIDRSLFYFPILNRKIQSNFGVNKMSLSICEFKIKKNIFEKGLPHTINTNKSEKFSKYVDAIYSLKLSNYN